MTHPQIVTDAPMPKTVHEPMDWSFLKELQVGHSAHFDTENDDELIRLRNNLSSAANRYGRRLDRHFTVRVRDDRSGLGVWRTR